MSSCSSDDDISIKKVRNMPPRRPIYARKGRVVTQIMRTRLMSTVSSDDSSCDDDRHIIKGIQLPTSHLHKLMLANSKKRFEPASKPIDVFNSSSDDDFDDDAEEFEDARADQLDSPTRTNPTTEQKYNSPKSSPAANMFVTPYKAKIRLSPNDAEDEQSQADQNLDDEHSPSVEEDRKNQADRNLDIGQSRAAEVESIVAELDDSVSTTSENSQDSDPLLADPIFLQRPEWPSKMKRIIAKGHAEGLQESDIERATTKWKSEHKGAMVAASRSYNSLTTEQQDAIRQDTVNRMSDLKKSKSSIGKRVSSDLFSALSTGLSGFGSAVKRSMTSNKAATRMQRLADSNSQIMEDIANSNKPSTALVVGQMGMNAASIAGKVGMNAASIAGQAGMNAASIAGQAGMNAASVAGKASAAAALSAGKMGVSALSSAALLGASAASQIVSLTEQGIQAAAVSVADYNAALVQKKLNDKAFADRIKAEQMQAQKDEQQQRQTKNEAKRQAEIAFQQFEQRQAIYLDKEKDEPHVVTARQYNRQTDERAQKIFSDALNKALADSPLKTMFTPQVEALSSAVDSLDAQIPGAPAKGDTQVSFLDAGLDSIRSPNFMGEIMFNSRARANLLTREGMMSDLEEQITALDKLDGGLQHERSNLMINIEMLQKQLVVAKPNKTIPPQARLMIKLQIMEEISKLQEQREKTEEAMDDNAESRDAYKRQRTDLEMSTMKYSEVARLKQADEQHALMITDGSSSSSSLVSLGIAELPASLETVEEQRAYRKKNLVDQIDGSVASMGRQLFSNVMASQFAVLGDEIMPYEMFYVKSGLDKRVAIFEASLNEKLSSVHTYLGETETDALRLKSKFDVGERLEELYEQYRHTQQTMIDVQQDAIASVQESQDRYENLLWRNAHMENAQIPENIQPVVRRSREQMYQDGVSEALENAIQSQAQAEEIRQMTPDQRDATTVDDSMIENKNVDTLIQFSKDLTNGKIDGKLPTLQSQNKVFARLLVILRGLDEARKANVDRNGDPLNLYLGLNFGVQKNGKLTRLSQGLKNMRDFETKFGQLIADNEELIAEAAAKASAKASAKAATKAKKKANKR